MDDDDIELLLLKNAFEVVFRVLMLMMDDG